MRRTLTITAIGIALLVPSAAGAQQPNASAAAVREYEGAVVSIDRDRRTFRLRDSERGTIRIKVRRSTRFERIAGFGGLRTGMRNVEATVRRADGRWIAIVVERSGGGGEHRGDDD